GSNCGGDYADGPNNDWGYGTIDALAAVQQAIFYGGTGDLVGTVTDASTSLPLPAATIQATFSPTLTWQTTSDDLGRYALRVFSGTYGVTALAYGYYTVNIDGVSIISGTTTTLNIPLTPAPSYVVSGTVFDANSGWPLYAYIDIDGYPGETFWTDPLSGFFSVALAADVSFVFHVGATNYSRSSYPIGPLAGNEVHHFGLQPDFSQGCGQGYDQVSLFVDGFESGNLGADWDIRSTNMGRVGVSTLWPYSGSYSVLLDRAVSGDEYSIASIVLTQDLSDQDYVGLDFWWREFNDENHPEDGVFISDDDGANWYPVLSFNDGPNAFRYDVVNISAAAAENGLILNDHLEIKFQFYDNYPIADDGYAIDEVRLSTCTPAISGRMVGRVYDANTGLALAHAVVESDSGQRATTDVDGVYELFDTPGTHIVTGTGTIDYGADIQSVALIQGDTVQQDFYLPAGWLSWTPPDLEATLEMGASTTVFLDLANNGGLPAAFELQERDRDFQILAATGPFADPNPLVSPEHQQAASTKGLDLPRASAGTILAAGDVIQSWSSGLATAWGIAYDGDNDTVWVGLGWDAANTIYEYQPDGTPTGRSHPYDWSLFYGPADSAFNWNTGMLWSLDVGGDNCLHEMDPNTGYTGNTICGPWGISQRGVAYDPTTDTWYVGGWNEEIIYHIDANGTLLDSAFVGLSIAGLAYNPDTQHLFVQTAGWDNDAFVLDASQSNAYSQIGQFHIGTLSQVAGLEIDCQGNLWAVDQDDEMVYQVESGETASLCHYDVPWLSEDPITGTVAASSNQPIAVTFDAGVSEITQPGQYYAELKIGNDTPYGLPRVSVTMTVTPPETWAKLAGVVRGLGYCDADPSALQGAPLLIEGSTGMTWTLETDANGFYQLWLDQVHSPLTITAAYPGHETGHVAGVIVAAQMTTAQDVGLRWLQPCIDIAPTALSARLAMGRILTQTLVISNAGAEGSSFTLVESDGGFITVPLALTDQRHLGGQAYVVVEEQKHEPASADRGVFLLSEGGPDPFGYTFSDSNEPGGPTYRWIEIAPPAGGGGTEIAALTGVDDGYFWPLLLPSAFNFYGTDYTEMAIASNGTLYFENLYLGYSNVGIPGTSYGINAFIAHFWDDLVIDPGAVYYQVIDSTLIVEYYQVRGFGTSDNGTWQVILFENGSILFQYQDVTFGGYRDYGDSATIGIQRDSTTGLQYSYNIPILSDGLAICFAYPGLDSSCSADVPWLSEDPASGSIEAGRLQTIDVVFDASVPEVPQPGEYYATIIVQTNDPLAPRLQVPVTMTVSSYGVEWIPSIDARSGDPNTTVTYDLQITNTGLTTDTFELDLASSVWPVTMPPQVGPLAAGASASVQVHVTVPALAAGGATDT
ncbi:MAG: carboxypeptidase regulatory-like domain-containing protein, partial [Anaerolineae bacterium]|nr:carboxypeptidase regulatory-like domain-containing protein [Anaerolineae bacterium]